MIVQSPLKKNDIRPNLRRVTSPEEKKVKGRKTSPGTINSASKKINLPKIKPWKVILATVLLGISGVLYLTHVFATQDLLKEVQLLEAEHNKVRSQFDDLKLRYDRMIGPSEIYQKAREQGFVNGGPADKVIIIRD